ncbi:restriction endonuclease subunit S [Bacteroides eggerthii]|uniref:Restriction endonuclease subunit S n=1 Tax=Bacteroides eggerthii TaxID=28111 RepID=A0ABT7U8B7_9BACE|nr:restriction endonuclease subunit S [Bacteroides eggerthii]
MDTKKLRQKILDLAIHGKLVPQDPNDEPASVLLERIKAEKERLIKEGKIKRTKKSAKASDTPHYPYLLPNGWEWCKFQDCMDVRDGTHDTPKYIEHGYPLITSKDFKNGKFDFSKTKYISSTDYQNIIKRSKVEVGDILYSMIGGNIGSMIQIRQENYFDMAIKNVALFKPYPKQSISTEYIAFFLESKIREYQSIAIGGAQPFVGLDVFRNTLVPLPPLAEQKRIVAEIERCFALIDQIEQSQSDLQTVIKQTQSKILDLAIHGKLVPQDPNDEPASELLKRINPKAEITCDNGHYENLPDSWCLTDIKSIFTINPKNKVADDVIAGFVPMINIADGYSNEFIFESKLWGDIKKGFTHFADGDIVVAKISPCLENRKSVIVTSLPNGIGAGTTELFVFRSQCVLPEYGLYFFKSDSFINNCAGTFNGVVGQQRVSKSIIENIKFPLSPISEQRRIVDAVHKVFAKLDAIMENL